jgi:hypothetical protein
MDSFKCGFEIAGRLREPGFRKRLIDAGGAKGCPLIPATPETVMGHVVGCMEHYDKGLIVMPDETQPEGVRLIWWEKR